MIRAAVLKEPCVPLQVEEFRHPILEKGAILLRTIYSEVCGTDVHLLHGKLPGTPYPIIPGHFSVGDIEECAGDIQDLMGHRLMKGDRIVFLDVHETCHACWYCLVAKESTRCPHRKVYGITYSSQEGLLGGWSEAIYLKPGVKALKLPAQVSPERFIGGGCGLPTAFHAVERGGVRLGDTVVVQGAGPVGLSTAALSALSGALQVIVLGAPAMRLEMALYMGADAVLDIGRLSSKERIERIRELTEGRGADVVIEASGNPQAVREGMAMARDGGRYVIVGQYTDHGPVEINPHADINQRHLEIRGCWGIDFSHFYRSVRILARHGDRFRWERMITKRYGLEQANQALNDVEQLRVVKAVIQP